MKEPSTKDVTTQRQVFENLLRRLDKSVEHHRQRRGSINEHVLTTSAVAQIGFLRRFAFATEDGAFVDVRVMPYEQNGSVEQVYGDMALIVDFAFDDGHAAQGVAYFENKIVRSGRMRFLNDQPEDYLKHSGHLYALAFDIAERPRRVLSAGLAASAHDTRVAVVPAGLILENRAHLPWAATSSLAAQLVYRSFLGYDLDLRPGAVGAAFAAGAQFYLHVDVKVGREFNMTRLVEQIPNRTKIPRNLVSMWDKNERMRQLAVELEMEPERVESLVAAYRRAMAQERAQGRDVGRNGPSGPSGGMSR